MGQLVLRKPKKSFCFVGGLLLSCTVAMGALCQQTECPTAELVLPPGIVNIEEEIALVVRISGNFSGSVEWKTSSGKILKGQGSPVASFMAHEEDEGRSIKVSAKLLGLSGKCLDEVSDVLPIAQIPAGDPVDTLGKMRPDKNSTRDFLSRLDSYFIAVGETSDYEGVVSIEFNAKDTRDHKMRHLMRIFDHIKFRKLDVSRFTFAVSEGNFMEQTRLWTAAPGARMPKYMRSFIMIKAEELKQKLSTLFKNKK